MQSEQAGESERDPENPGRQVSRADGRWIPREKEGDQGQQREHHDGEERATCPQLDREIFSCDRPRRSKQSWRRVHATPPGTSMTSSRYSTAYRFASNDVAPSRSSKRRKQPSDMIAACVASVSPSETLWVTSISVAPRDCSARSWVVSACAPDSSRPLYGSSSNTTAGSCTIARAI